MASPFVAEIRIFSFNFPPTGWAFCNGQLMPISQNTALFSLLGTYYGGDGKSTFALPDLQGNVAMGQGDGPGLSQRFLGESGGEQAVTLLVTEIPAHTHGMNGITPPPPSTSSSPSPTVGFGRSNGGQAFTTTGALVDMSPQEVAPTGSSFPHNNMMPYLALNYCIAMQGVFPPRG
jgi:microcystin-dependent protein